MEGFMAVSRHPTRQVPLARVALLAGEAFGHQAGSEALAGSAYSGQSRSALALVLIVCVTVAVYLAL
jgi:hypothetical protein